MPAGGFRQFVSRCQEGHAHCAQHPIAGQRQLILAQRMSHDKLHVGENFKRSVTLLERELGRNG
jgi:hypothetical protein